MTKTQPTPLTLPAEYLKILSGNPIFLLGIYQATNTSPDKGYCNIEAACHTGLAQNLMAMQLEGKLTEADVADMARELGEMARDITVDSVTKLYSDIKATIANRIDHTVK